VAVWAAVDHKSHDSVLVGVFLVLDLLEFNSSALRAEFKFLEWNGDTEDLKGASVDSDKVSVAASVAFDIFAYVAFWEG